MGVDDESGQSETLFIARICHNILLFIYISIVGTEYFDLVYNAEPRPAAKILMVATLWATSKTLPPCKDRDHG
jgi:hypothetical protein